jgi:hypothetical protein
MATLSTRRWWQHGNLQSLARSSPPFKHLTGDDPTVFEHVCRLGLEGVVSKRVDAPYRSGAVEDVAQGEEPAERSGAPGERGDMAIASPVVCSSPHGEHDPSQQGNAEDEEAVLDYLVVHTQFCHVPL